MPAIIEAAAGAGARWATYVPLRLPGAVADVFTDWMKREIPDKTNRVMDRLKSFRGGKLNTSAFHKRFQGQGPWSEELRHLFQLGCIKAGFKERPVSLKTEHFIPPGASQMEFEL